jgi:hypothetical protein
VGSNEASPPLNEEVVGPPSRICAFNLDYFHPFFFFIYPMENLSIKIREQRNPSKIKVR